MLKLCGSSILHPYKDLLSPNLIRLTVDVHYWLIGGIDMSLLTGH